MAAPKRHIKREPVVNGRQLLDQQAAERELQLAVVQLAQLLGYRCHHVYDSRLASAKVDPGFPDWIFAKDGRVLAVELKTERGKVSARQADWLYHLAALGHIETFIWRPRHWSSGEIERVLRGGDAQKREKAA